jgi:hypothetical protein
MKIKGKKVLQPQADDKTEKKIPFNEVLMVNHKFSILLPALSYFVFMNPENDSIKTVHLIKCKNKKSLLEKLETVIVAEPFMHFGKHTQKASQLHQLFKFHK